MSSARSTVDSAEDLAEQVADAVGEVQGSVAVAESLTGGSLASALARARGASSWFRGGVVAYTAEVKHAVLDVDPGPVVSERAALQMATGVARLMDATVGLAITGVGGPGAQEGQPPGTVWIAVAGPSGTTARRHRFSGEPDDVCRSTVEAALAQALDALAELPGV